jgi:hypothetical protein
VRATRIFRQSVECTPERMQRSVKLEMNHEKVVIKGNSGCAGPPFGHTKPPGTLTRCRKCATMPPTGCVLHVEHRRRPPVQETEEQNVQDVFGGLGQYRPNDAQTAPLAQPSHSHQAHQSGGRGLHLPTALPCFLGGYNEGKVRKTGSELPRVDFPYLIERSGGRGILPLVSRVPEPVLPKLTESLSTTLF